MNENWIKTQRKKLGLTQPELAKKIGVSIGTIVNYESGKKIPESKMSILSSVLGSDDNNELNEPSLNYEAVSSKKTKTVNLIPLYDIEAIGGDNYVADDAVAINPSEMIDVGDLLRDSKSAMRVYGNSMIPNYPPGCIVGLNEVRDDIISYGNVYVIETVDNRYIKRVYQADNGIECYSDNIAKFTEGPRAGKYYYETFIIPKESIRRMHRVVGVIKRNQNSTLIN